MLRGYRTYPKVWKSASAEGGADVGSAAEETGSGIAGNPAGDDSVQDGAGGESSTGNVNEGIQNALAAQLEQLKADFAKQKEALDAATKEAGNYRKQLRAKQTQEEIDAETKREAEEKAAKELEDLRREVAKTKSVKSVMSKLTVDEDTAGKIAECLVGCENIDAALLEIQKVWTAREKSLRLEYGKIPGPGAGGSSEEDAEEKAAIELAKALGRDRASVNRSVADGLKGYIR